MLFRKKQILRRCDTDWTILKLEFSDLMSNVVRICAFDGGDAC